MKKEIHSNKRYTAKKIALKVQTLLHLQGDEFTKNYSQS